LTSDEQEEYVPADDYARQQYLLKNSQFKVEDVDPDLATKGWGDEIVHEEFNDSDSRPVVFG
jgi:hypothetical protein